MNNRFANGLIFASFFLSLFSYEKHIHDSYYVIFEILITLFSVLGLLILIKNGEILSIASKKIRKNISWMLLVASMIVTILLSSILFPENSLLSSFTVFAYIINSYYFIFILPVYLKENKKFERNLFRMIVVISAIASIFGIILQFKNGFLGYELEGGRSGSFYFDPNYFAVISLIGMILATKCGFKKFIVIALIVVSVLAIFFSGSRGTMLSLFVGVIIVLIMKYPNNKQLKKAAILIGATIVLIVSYLVLDDAGFFRFYQGSNGRDQLLAYSLQMISESPIVGYGDVGNVLKEGGFSVTTSHNFLADTALRFGVITTAIELYIIIKSVVASISKKNSMFVCLLLVALLVNTNTILYSIGGVGFPSIMLTLSIGYALYGEKDEKA